MGHVSIATVFLHETHDTHICTHSRGNHRNPSSRSTSQPLAQAQHTVAHMLSHSECSYGLFSISVCKMTVIGKLFFYASSSNAFTHNWAK